MTKRIGFPLGLLVANAAAAVTIVATTVAPLRDLACVVVVLGPGFALARLIRPRDLVVEATLVLFASVVTLICVAQAVTYVALFSWRPCAITLLIITGLGTSSDLVITLIRSRATL